mmetsp:Transcript_75940/g.217455  ORF Transcript_75940/g.217455 Transcript_75940/m.217455 type:complete len:504 (-) Transcript_75940:179-1690(-)
MSAARTFAVAPRCRRLLPFSLGPRHGGPAAASTVVCMPSSSSSSSPSPPSSPLARQSRGVWTAEGGYRPRRDDPHRRPELQLQEGAEARLRRGHPWIFPREVKNAKALSQLSPCLVNVLSEEGDVLGVALYNKHGSIAGRVLSEQAFVQIDADFFAERLRRCLAYRERLYREPFYRLAHGEADGLPGLAVDRYGDHLTLQPTAAGLDALLWPLLDALEEVVKPKVIVLRQDAPGRRKERAVVQREVLRGQYRGPTELRENGVTFAVDLLHGQKTGWYFDHRDHRARLAELASQTPRVLDLYSFVGGFGITMAHYGAEEVVCVDSSEAALELCSRAAAMNNVSSRVKTVRADVLEFLGGAPSRPPRTGMLPGTEDDDFDDAGTAGRISNTEGSVAEFGEFDLVIVDPPNLGSDRTYAPKAVRFYERLIHAASRVVAKRGLLFVASCTHHVGEVELLGAAGRALRWPGSERESRVVSCGSQAADHPSIPVLPESRYLRSILLQLD